MRLFAPLALTLALVAPAFAGTFKFDKAQVELTSPEGWKSGEENGVVSMNSPDDSIEVIFLVLPGENREAASEALDAEIEKVVGEVTWPESGKEGEINGMSVEHWEGSAKEGALEVTATYIDTPAEETLVVYYAASPEAGEKFAKDLEALVNAIKPITK